MSARLCQTEQGGLLQGVTVELELEDKRGLERHYSSASDITSLNSEAGISTQVGGSATPPAALGLEVLLRSGGRGFPGW